LWRNKPLERAKKALADTNAKRAQSGEEPLALDEKYAMQSDTLVLIRKQRATGLEPVVHLWYDPTTTQFLSGPSSRPQSLMPFSVVENGAAA
jgi:hypothetical protein